MSSQIRIRTGELYSKQDVQEALGCGGWFVDALVNWYGLAPLGGAKGRFYEGGNIIAALNNHARDNQIQSEEWKPPSKKDIEARDREAKKTASA